MNRIDESISLARESELESHTYSSIGDFFDLEKIVAALIRNRWLVVGVIAGALALGALITMLTTRQYTATASVQVNQEADRILNSENVSPVASYQDADRFLQTQLDILSSRHLALKVVQNEGLLEDEGFLERARIEVDDTLPPEEKIAALREAVLEHLERNSDFTLPNESRILRVSYTDPDPAFSARIANSYTEAFIRDNLERRLDSSSYARSFLADQLAEAKVRLEESERELNDFALASGVVRLRNGATETADGGETATSRRLLSLNDAAAQAEAERVEAEARWRGANAAQVRMLPDVVANRTYQDLRTERSRLLGNLDKELAIHKEDHPTVVALRAELDAIDSQIGSITSEVKESLRNTYEAAVLNEQALKSRVEQLTGELLREEGRGVRYGILAREVDTNRVIYDGLLQRYKEVGAEAGITSNNLSQVDRATAPVEASKPQPLLNMAVALFLGTGLAVGLVFAREYVDDRLRTPRDVEERLALPTLGLIPMHRGDEPIRDALLDPKSSVAEAVHSLRTGVLIGLDMQRTKSLVVSSSEPAEGKSTTTMALARDIASLGRKTLLVDGDLRRPRLHKLLDLSNKVGLSDVLARSADLAEGVQQVGDPNFCFMSSGSSVTDAATMLNSDRLSDLLAELGESFDYIVIDGPPVLGLADAPNLASHVGAVLFVAEANRARARRARVSIRRLVDAGASIMGVVLSKVDFNDRSYGYGYGYGTEYYEYTGDSD